MQVHSIEIIIIYLNLNVIELNEINILRNISITSFNLNVINITISKTLIFDFNTDYQNSS